MSQQGFPNGGIMPDDDANNTYSNLIKTEDEIKNIANAIRDKAFDSSVIDPSYSVTISAQIEGIITAGLMLAQYYIQQVTYQGENGYGTDANPVIPPLSNQVSIDLLKSLGSDPEKEMLKQSYEVKARTNAGIDNLFYNLAFGVDAFSWTAEGNLQIKDNYRFTSGSDFTFSGGNFLTNMIGAAVGVFVFGPVANSQTNILSLATSPQYLAKALFQWFEGSDKTYPFYYLEFPNGDDPIGLLGGLEDMRFGYSWTPQQIYEYNPELFWAAVAKGYIPFSALLAMPDFICNSIEVGAGPTAFLPNFGQVNADIGTNPNNWTFGGGGNYPRPFTSFSQRIVEATYSLGPFAMLDYANPTTGTSTRISGRIANLGVVCPESSSGDTGFIRQNWYGADTGGTGYGSNLLKWQWWEQCVKTKHTFPYGHLPGHPDVTIEVATASYAVGNAANFTPDLPAPEDFTLLLGVVLAAGVLGAIL